MVHLSGVFSKLPQGLVSLSLADNGITSKGTCILLSYYTYAAINFFGNLLKILRFKSLVFLCVYMLLSINKQCTFVSCGKIISLCTVDNSSFSFLTSLVWLCVSQVQPHWVRHYGVISIMRPPYRGKHLILIIKS